MELDTLQVHLFGGTGKTKLVIQVMASHSWLVCSMVHMQLVALTVARILPKKYQGKFSIGIASTILIWRLLTSKQAQRKHPKSNRISDGRRLLYSSLLSNRHLLLNPRP